jgi:hypothetical protein
MKERVSFYCGALFVLASVSMNAGPAQAWGAYGHQIAARVALANVPADMPVFFRDATDEMAMLISEPDQWRSPEERELKDTTTSDHTIRWEIVPKPLPRTRYAFVIQLAKAGKVTPELFSVNEYGTAPYAIQEWSEMLTGAFRRWRAMREKTPEDIARKRMQEKSILFIAGVLGHWVTDVANPMHTSVHLMGWSPNVPNPNGYTTYDPKNVQQSLHVRYESTYVDHTIKLSDVAPSVDNKARVIGDWLDEAETHIAASNSHVEQIYIWDKQARFGEGHEPAAAKPFTATRLADGARETRDYWYTAWVRSGEPMPGSAGTAGK